MFIDDWGPLREKGKNGERYFLSIIDDFSRKDTVFPIKEKNQRCFVILRNHVIQPERFFEHKLMYI